MKSMGCNQLLMYVSQNRQKIIHYDFLGIFDHTWHRGHIYQSNPALPFGAGHTEVSKGFCFFEQLPAVAENKTMHSLYITQKQ